MPHVSVGGIKVATASRAELTRLMAAQCTARRRDGAAAPPQLVFDSNGQALSLAASDPAYRAAMDAADIVHADGAFVVLASRWLSAGPVAERSATTDLIHDFAAAAEAEDLSFYLLGGTEEVNRLCAEKLVELYPRLRIAGRHHGFFGGSDETKVLADIAAADPDLLWIGLGKPLEQMFAVRHRDRLKAAWVITCGGCFNYVTGHYSRAPGWMQKIGFEWLYRAFTDPCLFRRYLTTSPHAIWVVLRRADRGRYNSARATPP
jgi:exopolysaccharide biosynthesis WecB/TagA/CpsF family protein